VVDPKTYKLKLGGLVKKTLELSLAEIQKFPSVSIPVTMECAGNGRVNMKNRYWTHVPWGVEAIGTSVWTGVPLHLILEKAGLKPSATELLFTGLDKGIQGKEVQYFQRSLTISEATTDEVILAYEMNGQPLLPQHGAPLRLIVPGWYGMTNVKWLDTIEAIDYQFEGYQMHAYSVISDPTEVVTRAKRITHLKVRSLMVPPGIADFFTQTRLVEATPKLQLEGRAWAGATAIRTVEVSTDGGKTWAAARLGKPVGKFAWTRWEFDWMDVRPGRYQLVCRATDVNGGVQDPDDVFNYYAMVATSRQRVDVQVLTTEELAVTGTKLPQGPEPDMHRANL